MSGNSEQEYWIILDRDQPGLTEKSVSAHHSIGLQLNLNDEHL